MHRHPDQVADQPGASVRARQLRLDNLPFGLLIELPVVTVPPVVQPLWTGLLKAAQIPVNGPTRDPECPGRFVLWYLPSQDPLDEFFSRASVSLYLA
jgi:hypothetical protein